MSGFDEWFDGNKRTLYEDERWVAKKAWDARQAEIDELKSQTIAQGQRFNDQSQKVSDLEFKCDELQKRIDEVIEELKYPTASWEEVVFCTIKHLRGGENEN